MNHSPLPKTLPSFIAHFAKQYRWSFLLFILAPTLIVLETTIQPYAMKLIVDGIANAPAGLEKIPASMMKGIWLYCFASIFLVIWFRGVEWWQTRIIPDFQADIRMKTLEHLSHQSYGYFVNHFAGNIANKVSDLPKSIDMIRKVFCWDIVGSTAITLTSVIMISTVNTYAAMLLLTWIVLHLSVTLWMARYVDRRATVNAEDKSQLSGLVVDMLSNILPVKIFARTREEYAVIQKKQDTEVNSNRALFVTILILRTCMDLLIAPMMIGLLYVLILAWQKGWITAGDVTFVIMCMFLVMGRLWFLGQNLMDFFREIGVAKQALVLITTPIDINDAENAEMLRVKEGRIEFESVSFNYHHKHELFSNKNVRIQAGTKVGLVGYSGSGKTTFVHLILRFFDVLSGKILIDGQDIAQVTQQSLHESIVMVPQDTTLFHRTIYDNIQYGNPEASYEEVLRASKLAHCHEFIDALPEKYDTLVGERGIKLSGGQRQRIAIARAMLKNAPILIMDEATAALDSVTEKYIQEAMQNLMGNRTTIVIAHRLSTLAEMNRILVFDKGHIIEDGTHDELIAQKGHYEHMWRMQAGGFLPESASGQQEKNQ